MIISDPIQNKNRVVWPIIITIKVYSKLKLTLDQEQSVCLESQIKELPQIRLRAKSERDNKAIRS